MIVANRSILAVHGESRTAAQIAAVLRATSQDLPALTSRTEEIRTDPV